MKFAGTHRSTLRQKQKKTVSAHVMTYRNHYIPNSLDAALDKLGWVVVVCLCHTYAGTYIYLYIYARHRSFFSSYNSFFSCATTHTHVHTYIHYLDQVFCNLEKKKDFLLYPLHVHGKTKQGKKVHILYAHHDCIMALFCLLFRSVETHTHIHTHFFAFHVRLLNAKAVVPTFEQLKNLNKTAISTKFCLISNLRL